MSSDIRLTPELRALLAGSGIDPDQEATITGGAWYTTLLEMGSSSKAPQGVFRSFRPEYRQILEAEIEKAMQAAIRRNQPLGPALEKGFAAGVRAIMRAIEEKTPVKTGRARSSWTAKLPNGRKMRAQRVVGDVRAYNRKRRKRRRNRLA